jgi:16S rRNA (uracil1498-N3)-methyltransferase
MLTNSLYTKALFTELFLFLRIMVLPFFCIESLKDSSLILSEDTSKHIIQVLRMQKGEKVLLTDGKGKKAEAEIVDDNRKRCAVKIIATEIEKERQHKVAIAISLIKNASRFEWFLEKATEIGVSEIIPLICERTEKEKFRFDRMQNILISAMLQSQQCWLPVLHQPTEFEKAIQSHFEKKFIAHCEETSKASLPDPSFNSTASQLILIGPEGDFSSEEIESALKNSFIPVSLGTTRLRTETAGIVAAALLCIH